MAENHLGGCVCANLIFSSRFSHVSRLIPENTGYENNNNNKLSALEVKISEGQLKQIPVPGR